MVPTSPELMDLHPVVRVVRSEVIPLELAHLLVLTRVDPLAMNRAQDSRTELRRNHGLVVAETAILILFTSIIEPGCCTNKAYQRSEQYAQKVFGIRR